MPRRDPKRSGSAPFVDVVAYGALWRTGVWELFTRIRAYRGENGASWYHAPQSAIRDHLNESDQTRPFRISPGRALRAPPVGCTSRGRHCSCALCAISAQSGCCEMSPDTARLRPDRAPAPRPSRGVSGGGRRALPGDIQNARDCLVATNSARMAAFGAWLGSTWLARRPHANVERAPKRAWNSRAPNAAILAEFVATQQPRAF